MPAKKRNRHRIAIDLPPDHPVWSYPPGRRAAKMREWVENWLALGSRLQEMHADLKRELVALQTSLNHAVFPGRKKDEQPAGEDPAAAGLDPRLAAALDEWLDL
ncbi:MAG: hypothetical protein AB1776_03225 [Bacillota bacterium]